MLFTANSCKKEVINSGSPAATSPISPVAISPKADEATNVTQKDIANWIANIPGGVPFPLQLDKMQKGVFSGKYVVKIPIADDVALFFTKQNDSLKVFAYTWHNENTGSSKFTGKSITYNLQTLTEYRTSYKDGIIEKMYVYKGVEKTTFNKSKNSLNIRLNGFWSDIAHFLAHVACNVFGGGWYSYWWDPGNGDCSGGLFALVAEYGDNSETNPDDNNISYLAIPTNVGTDVYFVNMIGGGAVWFFTPQAAGSNGCDLQNEAIKKKNVNDFYGGTPPPQPPPPQDTGNNGCGTWTAFPISMDDLISSDNNDLPELLDTTGLSSYPRFKAIVTNMPNFLSTYPNITQALAYYTGFSQAKIRIDEAG